jgi:hypothetical protein
MKAPKKPTGKDIINKPLSSKEDDDDEENEMLDKEVVDEDDDLEVDEGFDVPIDDISTFNSFDDDDDDDDLY